MKKILTLFTALLLFGSMTVVQADYFVAGTMNGWTTNSNDWKMSLVSGTIYSKTASAMSAGDYQFKITNGSWSSSWGGGQKDNTQSNVTLSGSDNISFTLSTTSDVTFYFDAGSTKKIYVQATPVVVPSYTFPAGTTIYYDFTAYKAGIDVYAPGSNGYYGSTSAIIAITLSSDWEVIASTKLWRSGAGGSWNDYYCTTLPEDGHNMIVSTDGSTYTWGTYVPAPPTPPTYTVVGDVPGLDWNQEGTTNDMTEDNGVYTLTLTDVTLAANTPYQYKMVMNHSWDVSYPQSGNANFQVTTAGIYDVTFTLDLSASPEYSVTPTLKQATVVIPTVKMHGTFADGSTWADTQDFTIASNNESASLTLANLPAGNYEFKVIVGSSWLGNGHTFYRDYTGASNIGAGGNMTLEADVTGDYTFTWTYETNALSIEFPAEPTPEYVDIQFFAPRTEDNPWEHVYAYSFKGSRKFLGEWPGTEITSTKNDGWYEVSVRKGSNLIFTDNAGMQTNDLDIQAAACYEPTSIYYPTDPADAKIVTVTPNANCAVQYYIAGSQTLFGGEADWAINLPLDANNEIVFQNVEPDTYAFKINNGTWAWAIGGYSNLSNEEGCGTIAVEVGTGDIGFTIGTKQDVTISYNPTTQKICLGAVTVKTAASISVEDMTVFVDKSKNINPTYTTDATEVQYEILTGSGCITIVDGKVTGVAEGTATVRATVPETDNYLSAFVEFTVTVEPLKYYLKNNWNGGDWTWQEMTAVSDGTFRLENVVYGGHGINYNYEADDAGAVWKDYTKIKYMDGETAKLVEAFDVINLVLDPANDTIWAEMAQKNNPVYTVASNSLALCDLGWAPTHPYKYTDMKKQTDGTYMWNHEDAKVILPAGEVKLKIFKDRSYDNGSWPASGFVYNIQRSGEYEITVHFNPWTKEITIDTTCVKPLNIQVPLYIKGSWNNWSATPMLLGGYNDKAIVTLSFAETGTYNFKLEDVKEKWYGDGQAFTRNNSSHKDIEAKDESATEAMTLQVDKAGDYLVTYFYDGEILLVQYPAIAPAEPIAPLNGKFTINAKGDTAVFSRGNLHYNYESDAWYAAENQYDALGDLNLRFGDATYTGSIDLFGWSSENSDFGKQWKYRDEEFAGDFVDWGTLFAGDEKEWSTLSIAEWQFLLARTKDNHNLWTILAIGPDSLSGLVLFPDNWEAPAGLTIKYGFFDLEKEEDLRANSFSYEQWEAMETAGAVFLPLAGQRAGYYGNTWDGNKENNLSNPLASGYDWVDEVNGMTYYWTSTPDGEIRAYCFSVPGFNATSWLAPMPLNRERRRGHPVRLVTRIPKVEWTELRTGLEVNRHYTVCYEKNITAIDGATFWNLEKRNTEGTLAYLEEVTAPEAGKPYIIQATKETLKVVYGNESENDPVENGALRGTFVYMSGADLEAKGSDVYMLFNNELRPIGTNNHLDAHRAYILYNQLESVSSAPNAAPGKRVKAMPMQRDAAQGFENIESGDKPMKVMIDGALYILRGENVYDATGRLVK